MTDIDGIQEVWIVAMYDREGQKKVTEDEREIGREEERTSTYLEEIRMTRGFEVDVSKG